VSTPFRLVGGLVLAMAVTGPTWYAYRATAPQNPVPPGTQLLPLEADGPGLSRRVDAADWPALVIVVAKPGCRFCREVFRALRGTVRQGGLSAVPILAVGVGSGDLTALRDECGVGCLAVRVPDGPLANVRHVPLVAVVRHGMVADSFVGWLGEPRLQQALATLAGRQGS